MEEVIKPSSYTDDYEDFDLEQLSDDDDVNLELLTILQRSSPQYS